MQQRIFRGTILLALTAALALLPANAAIINQTTNLTDDQPDAPSQTDLVQPKFATAIDDLPLMPGLNLIRNNDVVFGSPGAGRIVETDAVGTVDIDDVYKFYRRTLPQLGWKAVTMRHYRRENDALSIDAHADGKTTLVHFMIKPANSNTK